MKPHSLPLSNYAFVRFMISTCILFFTSLKVFSADLVEVSSVSKNILMLRFDEGHIDYSGIDPSNGDYQGTFGNFQTVYWDLFDLAAGKKKENYIIKANGKTFRPTSVYVKAKGRDYNDPQVNDGEPDQIMEYKIYLVLPQVLKKGVRYSIELGDLASNLDTYTFVFDEKNIRSETIHVNQLGFTPTSEKYVYLSQWMGTCNDLDLSNFSDATVKIYDVKSNQVVRTYNGFNLQKSKNEKDNNPWGNFTKADVWDLNFSDFKNVGKFKIVVEGLGCSYPFEINRDIYREAYYLAMRGLYYQRSGIVRSVDEFDGTIYPRAHHSDLVDFYYDGKQKVYKHGDISNFSYNKKINRKLYGWYNDAGDWDYYTRHWVIPSAICFLYNLKPSNFADGAIKNRYKKKESDNQWIEEGKNGIPDLLDEAAWMVKFGKRFKDALLAENYGTGGIPGYVGEEAGAGGKPSWEDRRRMRVTAEMPGSTFLYAGAAAMYAYSLRQFNKRGGNAPQSEIYKWINEAKKAFEWAENRYTDELRSRQLAAVSLYLYTGDNKYQQAYEQSHNGDHASKFNGAWQGLPTFTVAQAIYAILCADKSNLNQAFHESIVKIVERKANANLGTNFGFRLGGVERGQFQKLNLWTVPRTFYQAAAYELTGDQKYLASIENTVAYHLGANPDNLATMTGLGDNPETDAFHIDSWYLHDYNDKVYENPILSGFTVYGRKAFDVGGIGNEARTVKTFIPKANVNEYTPWPVAEGRSHSRWSISGSEFTVDQNNIWSIFAFGYLSDNRPLAFRPNKAPTVRLDLVDNQPVSINEVTLKSKVSSDTRKVKYYFDWHYIGESTNASNDFSLKWNPKKVGFEVGDKVEITAVAYDDQGLIALYDDRADKEVIFVNNANSIHPVPGLVEAEVFSAQKGVVVESTTDTGKGKNIGFIQESDYVEYTLDVKETAVYRIDCRVASATDGGNINIYKDEKSLGIVSVSKTGGWQKWSTVNTEIQLEKGLQTIRLVFTGNGSGYLFNLNWMKFIRTNKSISTDITHNIPGLVEAEAFSVQKGVVIESTSDTDKGENIGFIQRSDYTEYALNVTSSAIYKVEFRVASATNGGNINLYNGNELLGTVSVPKTGGWQKWSTINTEIRLEKGLQTIRLVFAGNGSGFLFNLNWMKFIRTNKSFLSLLGVSEEDEVGMKIYPNPFSNNLFIDLAEYNEPASLSLYNMQGQEVWHRKLEPAIHTIQDVSISKLPAGIYFLKVKSSGQIESKVIQKE